MSTGEQVGAPTAADHVVGVAPPQKMNRYLWLVLVSAFLAWMFDSIALNSQERESFWRGIVHIKTRYPSR